MLEWFELKVNTNYKIKKHNLHCVIFLLAQTSHNDTKCTPLLKVAHPLTYFAHPLISISNHYYYLILELLSFSNNIWNIAWCSIKTEIFI